MKGAAIYFSGTGNTEFIIKLFKEELKRNEIACTLIDVSKKKTINDDYNFFIFGCPIHADFFPDYFMDWIEQNIKNGNNRKCIVFSTQAGKTAAGAEHLSEKLKQKGFKIEANTMIQMPQNFYLNGLFKKTPEDKCIMLKENAAKIVKTIVDKFLKGENVINNVSRFRVQSGRIIYSMFKKYALGWAKNNLKVDMSLCVRCGKCVKNCPTKNIILEEEINFKLQCLCCQKCLHGCPVNAFRFKNKKILQYKI